jgi:hypothetical protein
MVAAMIRVGFQVGQTARKNVLCLNTEIAYLTRREIHLQTLSIEGVITPIEGGLPPSGTGAEACEPAVRASRL